VGAERLCYNRTMDPIAVLFNPSSGRGKSRRRKNRIEARFGHFDIPARWFTSQSEDHLKELARSLAQDFSTIAVVGGDTTFTLAATEIIQSVSDTTLGMVGTGSANDISRGLQADELDSICAALRSGRTRRMDAGNLRLPGRAEPVIFMGAMSLGLGVEVNLFIAGARQRHPILNRGGSTVQALTGVLGVHSAFSSRAVPERVCLEAGRLRKDVDFSLMVFANTPFFANGLRLFPEATPFDGRLHCCTIRTRSLSHTLFLSRRIRNGSHVEQDEVEIFPDTVFRVQPARGTIAIQYDGEVMTGIEGFEVSVRPAALRVIDTTGE